MKFAEESASCIAWNIDSPTPGVVLIDLSFEGTEDIVPLHWRVGTWEKPPLDIALDSRGSLVSVQLVLQDEKLDLCRWTSLDRSRSCLPIFDISAWAGDRYQDERIALTVCKLSSGELGVRFANGAKIKTVCRISGLTLAFSDLDQLVEIRIGPLSEDEWDAIHAFSKPPAD